MTSERQKVNVEIKGGFVDVIIDRQRKRWLPVDFVLSMQPIEWSDSLQELGVLHQNDRVYVFGCVEEFQKKQKPMITVDDFELETLLALEDLKKICNELVMRKEQKKMPFVCAKFFLSKNHAMTFNDTDEIFLYENGVYVPNGETTVKKFLQERLEDLSNNNLCLEVLHHIRRETYTKRELVLSTPKNLICLQNGIFDLEKMELQALTPDIFFLQKIPVEYNAGATCPMIEKFLSEVLAPIDISLAYEIAGYCLERDYPIQKAFVFVGSGRNGKSVFLNVIRNFLGNENVCARSLHDLLLNRFAKADLFGKLSNIYADLPARVLQDSADFKMLTGGDLIQGEKKFKSSFSFVNYAKLLFSANSLSKTPEDSDAFFRRWCIINFPNEFDEDKSDKNLLSKLTTKEELSGFFNKAIEGLKRLKMNGCFTNSLSIQQTREKYIRMSDSVQAFSMDCLEANVEEFVEKRKLFELYADYCRTKGYLIKSENVFHRELLQCVKIEDYRPLDNGKRVQCWKGIKVRDVNDVKDIPDLNVQKQKNLEQFNEEPSNSGPSTKVENIPDNPDTLDREII